MKKGSTRTIFGGTAPPSSGCSSVFFQDRGRRFCICVLFRKGDNTKSVSYTRYYTLYTHQTNQMALVPGTDPILPFVFHAIPAPVSFRALYLEHHDRSLDRSVHVVSLPLVCSCVFHRILCRRYIWSLFIVVDCLSISKQQWIVCYCWIERQTMTKEDYPK